MVRFRVRVRVKVTFLSCNATSVYTVHVFWCEKILDVRRNLSHKKKRSYTKVRTCNGQFLVTPWKSSENTILRIALDEKLNIIILSCKMLYNPSMHEKEQINILRIFKRNY